MRSSTEAPQVGRGLLQPSASASCSHHHSRKGPARSKCSSLSTFFALCNISCAFLQFNTRCYEKLSYLYPFQALFILFIYYLLGILLKTRPPAVRLSEVRKMDFCGEVRTNSISGGAERWLQAAAAGGAQADKAVTHKAVLCDILIVGFVSFSQ